ncbi:MAG: hypothetical protein WCO54_05540 [Bacteroidota bacterium]
MKNKFLILIILLGITSAKVSAQEEDNRNEKIESLKIAFITEKLNLTSSEAKVFWPVFNEFSDELKKLKEKEKENMHALKTKNSPTDIESNKFINEHINLKQAELDLTKRYINEFKKVLPERKVAKLLTLEQEFKQQLLQHLKDKREKMQR